MRSHINQIVLARLQGRVAGEAAQQKLPTGKDFNALRRHIEYALAPTESATVDTEDQQIVLAAYTRLLNGSVRNPTFPESWQELSDRMSRDALMEQANIIYTDTNQAQMPAELADNVASTARKVESAILDFIAQRTQSHAASR